jgi:hypothetical protein
MFGSQQTVRAQPTTVAPAAEPSDGRPDPGRTGAAPDGQDSAKPTAEEDDDVQELRDPNRFRRLRRAFLISGLTSWAAAYGIGAVVAFSTLSSSQSPASAHAAAWLFAPLVGPWMALARWPRCGNGGADSSGNCDSGWSGLVAIELLVIDGLLQGAGATLITVALVLPHDRALARASPVITPYARPDGAGVVMAGAF